MDCIDQAFNNFEKFIIYICNCAEPDVYTEMKKNDDYEESQPLINRKRHHSDIENQLDTMRKKSKTTVFKFPAFTEYQFSNNDCQNCEEQIIADSDDSIELDKKELCNDKEKKEEKEESINIFFNDWHIVD